jgi:predicted AAA+ superfamily ATPase
VTPDRYVTRSVEARLVAALADTPVVVLNGPRQAGKSTLIAHLASRRPSTALVTIDSAAERSAAHVDPEGYVLALHSRFGTDTVAIDEVQLAPDLFRGLRYLQQGHPDRFLAGVVLHCRSETLPFGPGLHAMPISALWTT